MKFIIIFFFLLSYTGFCSNPYEIYIEAEKLYEAGKLFDSLEKLDNAIDIEPKFIKAYYLKAKIFEEDHDYKKALKIYKIINELEKEIKERIEITQKKDPVKTKIKIKELTEKFNIANKLYIEGRSTALKGDFKTAIKLFENCIELNSDEPEYYKACADAYADSEEFNDAIKYYLRAIELKKNYFDVYFSLAEIYYKTLQKNKYIKILQKALFEAKNIATIDPLNVKEIIPKIRKKLSKVKIVESKVNKEQILIIKRLGKNVYFNKGINNGIKYSWCFSKKFTIYSRNSKLNDIETQLPIKEERKAVGIVVLSSVESNISKGIIIKEFYNGIHIGDNLNIASGLVNKRK